jgi:tetratricopeptide (TPR) repeat protein
VNGVNVAGTSPNLIAIQKMQAHVPLLTFGPSKNKRVLHIGFGSGGTAYAASLYPNTHITVVEISRGIVRNADTYFRSVNHGIANGNNVQFIYFDGRSYLQNTSETYDVILSDSIHPRYSGNGSLYTKDYYQLVYKHLNPQGVHSQWIPIYSVASNNMQEILKAFSDVFEDCNVWYINSTVNPFIIVTGRKQASGISLKNFREAFEIVPVAQDLKSIGMNNEYFLLDHFLFGSSGFKKYVGDVGPHIDDLVSVEYESSRIVNRDLSWWINFHNLLQYREPVLAYLSDAENFHRDAYERFYNATTVNLEGHELMLERKFPEAKKKWKEALRLNPDDREPFEYFHAAF